MKEPIKDNGLRIFMNGNTLWIVKKDFVDSMTNHSVFVPIDKGYAQAINLLTEVDSKKKRENKNGGK